MKRAHTTTPAEYAVFLVNKYPDDARGQGDMATWPVQWANESLQLSKDAHRGLVLGDHEEAQDRSGSPHLQWPVTLPSDYAKRSTDEAELQLAKAGRRLANVLLILWPN